ncbi:hypothetical protein D3C76_421000 [compost metagenome]
MGQAVHGEATVVAVEQFQVGEDAVGQGGGEAGEVAGNRGPVLGGTVIHVGEVGALIHQVLLLGALLVTSVGVTVRTTNHARCQLAILGGHRCAGRCCRR